ncbi:MAG TPA: NnrS family protein, partial [Rhodospirillaceae bacterium]|nr:NnrS family protein [Rhodospirillaceae bacterium]
RGIQAFQTDQMKMDVAALLSLLAVTLCLVFAKETVILGIIAALSCLIHGLRMRHYHSLQTGRDPLLWILHAGYAWLIIGLGLLSLSGFGLFDIKTILHAFTAGCIGSMILGMICRVTLGHTGRELKVGKVMTIAFIALQIAALMRVFGPMLIPDKTMEWIICSALLWAFCFATYLLLYGRMLFSPRPDGQEA